MTSTALSFTLPDDDVVAARLVVMAAGDAPLRYFHDFPESSRKLERIGLFKYNNLSYSPSKLARDIADNGSVRAQTNHPISQIVELLLIHLAHQQAFTYMDKSVGGQSLLDCGIKTAAEYATYPDYNPLVWGHTPYSKVQGELTMFPEIGHRYRSVMVSRQWYRQIQQLWQEPNYTTTEDTGRIDNDSVPRICVIVSLICDVLENDKQLTAAVENHLIFDEPAKAWKELWEGTQSTRHGNTLAWLASGCLKPAFV